MKISKKDALMWFEFFAELPEDEELMPHQQEIALAALAQIETAVNTRRAERMAKIDGLQSLSGRTYFVGDKGKFPRGCASCLMGTVLSAIRKTNKCNVQCKFCYNYGELDCQPPIGEGMWEIGGTKFYEDDIDLLLSIHLNSDASAATNGLECYAAPPALAANAESVRFGRLVTAAFRDQLGLTLRGWDGVRYLYFDANNARVVAESSDTTVRSDPTFTVLEDCGCPAVLVEEGFITNASDRTALCTDSACEQAAELYYQCIIDFFE